MLKVLARQIKKCSKQSINGFKSIWNSFVDAFKNVWNQVVDLI